MVLRDKVCVVTGGASGIGLATTKLFLDNGAKVVVADMNREGGEVRAKQPGIICVHPILIVPLRADPPATWPNFRPLPCSALRHIMIPPSFAMVDQRASVTLPFGCNLDQRLSCGSLTFFCINRRSAWSQRRDATALLLSMATYGTRDILHQCCKLQVNCPRQERES